MIVNHQDIDVSQLSYHVLPHGIIDASVSGFTTTLRISTYSYDTYFSILLSMFAPGVGSLAHAVQWHIVIT